MSLRKVKFQSLLEEEERVVDGSDYALQYDGGDIDIPKFLRLIRISAGPGLAVAITSLTLSPAFAMAQKASPMMGLITAVYAAAVAGILGGSDVTVVSPAAAFVSILYKFTFDNGEESIPLVTILAGILCFIVFATGIDKHYTKLPPSVIQGFSFGVATTITMTQLSYVMGLYDWQWQREIYLNAQDNIEKYESIDLKEILFFLFIFCLLCASTRMFQAIPYVAVMCLAYGYFMTEVIEDARLTKYAPKLLKDVYPALVSDGNMQYFKTMTKPEQKIPKTEVMIAAVKVAIVAILETVFCSGMAMAQTMREFKQSREMLGMSVANVVCGLMGGIPCSGVLITTQVNHENGGASRMSQFLSAGIVFAIVIKASEYFTYMPMAGTSGIILACYLRGVRPGYIREFWNNDRFEFFIMTTTWIVCVVFDGASGVVFGVLLRFFITKLFHPRS